MSCLSSSYFSESWQACVHSYWKAILNFLTSGGWVSLLSSKRNGAPLLSKEHTIFMHWACCWTIIIFHTFVIFLCLQWGLPDSLLKSVARTPTISMRFSAVTLPITILELVKRRLVTLPVSSSILPTLIRCWPWRISMTSLWCHAPDNRNKLLTLFGM